MSEKSPIVEGVTAARHTPQYKMHKYYARRPYNVFQLLISHYTKENDIVLDCFCGGGVTVFEACKLNRKVIGVDINPLAAFISRMQLFTGDFDILENEISTFISEVEAEYASWYYVSFEDDSGYAQWVEWAYVVKCPDCGEDIILSEDNKISNGFYACPNENCKSGGRIKRTGCKSNGSIPLRVKYISEKDNSTKIRILNKKEVSCILSSPYFTYNLKGCVIPDITLPLDWDRQLEDKLFEKGIVSYKDFFTHRNFALNTLIFNKILKDKASNRFKYIDYLYFLFSSSLRYTNKMSRVTDNWEGGKPTSMDKHAFWLPNQYIEANIIDVLKTRGKSILAGCKFAKEHLPSLKETSTFKELEENANSYLILNQSSSNLPLKDESIDVVITDPPYGSNVQYAELTVIWNAWYQLYSSLDSYIYKDEEAIVNRKLKIPGAKTEDDYERLLHDVYLECNRVLKKGGYLVFTFNNKNLKVWIAMMKAVSRAGFYLPEGGIIFQDFIQSYKNTAHLRFAGNVHGDFIYSFVKGKNPKASISLNESLEKVIEDAILNELSRLYNLNKSYSTTKLYEYVFSALVNTIMSYIEQHIDGDADLLSIDNYSDSMIENILKTSLVYEDGLWRKKEGFLHA